MVAALLAGGGYALQRSRAYPIADARRSEIEEGKIDAAIPFFETAMKLRPGAAGMIHSQLAEAYRDKKDLAGAQRELQKAAAAYRAQGMTAEADAAAQQAEKLKGAQP